MIDAFSLEFILRRFDGDAASTMFETEPVRLPVVETTGEDNGCCGSDGRPT